MATAFPTGLDNYSDPSAGDALTGHAGKHTDLNDAVEAIEAKVGVNGSAVATSLDARTAKLEKLGTLGYAQVTANQGSITVGTDLTGLTQTITVPTGRRLKITGHVDAWISTVASDRVIFRIMEDGVEIGRCVRLLEPVTGNACGGGQVVAVKTPSAGSRTYKLQAESADGGTVTMQAAASRPAFILVEDIGAA